MEHQLAIVAIVAVVAVVGLVMLFSGKPEVTGMAASANACEVLEDSHDKFDCCGAGADKRGCNGIENAYTKAGCGELVCGFCGDGIAQPELGEQCDDGANNGIPCTPQYGSSCVYCSVSCTDVVLQGDFCGDGIVNGPEECDDGNTASGDGCSCGCLIEEEPPVLYGDSNLDEVLDFEDIRLMLAFIFGREEMPEVGSEAFTVSDLNGDLVIDLDDTALLVNYLNEVIGCFPVEFP